MISVIERVPNSSGRGVTYYIPVFDTDSRFLLARRSKKVAWVKAWDTDEIPGWALMYLLYDWLRRETWKTLRETLELNKPTDPEKRKPKGLMP
jgi:hypothetical protein